MRLAMLSARLAVVRCPFPLTAFLERTVRRLFLVFVLIGAAATQPACSSADDPPGGDTRSAEPAPPPSNRIDVPAAVRRNLGVTFARVERRNIANTVRVPGRFEWLPTARHEHRTPMAGRVELLVEQYQRVEPGDVLYRLDSPDWRDMQREIEDTKAAIQMAQARLSALAMTMEAHELHERGLREAVDLWEARVEQLEGVQQAGGGRASAMAEAQANLNEARSAFGEVMEKHADLQLQQAEHESELQSAKSRLELLLRSAAPMIGVPYDETDLTETETSATPQWKLTDMIDVRAARAGVVELLPVSPGAWVERGELVVSTVNPDAVRFRAIGLQSDLAKLRSGLSATIVPPRGGESFPGERIEGTLEIGLNADPQQRTVDLFVHPTTRSEWTRAGVSAFLEIALESTTEDQLSIPLSAIVRDGLTPVMFRRDPANPDAVIRVEADLGIDDGRWVVVESGVREGDEVVLDGAYQLMLATSGTAQRGGHFHSDGTFHADDH